MQGVVWYHLPRSGIINTVREVGHVDHIMQQSLGSCGSPSGPNATPGGRSPMISVGGAPCSCICFAGTQHHRCRATIQRTDLVHKRHHFETDLWIFF